MGKQFFLQVIVVDFIFLNQKKNCQKTKDVRHWLVSKE
jgi:hypothetical protein